MLLSAFFSRKSAWSPLAGLRVLLTTPAGRALFSILVGLALAALLRPPCRGKECFFFQGPVFDQVAGRTFRHGRGCYRLEATAVPPDARKTVVPFASRARDPLALSRPYEQTASA